jgi:hypothetical protein
MDIVHVAVWVHDHGLDVSYLWVGDIERWVQYVRLDGGGLHDSDGGRVALEENRKGGGGKSLKSDWERQQKTK